MTYDEYEKEMIANADSYTACNFLGRAGYGRSDGHKTLDSARAAAKAIIAGRPADDRCNKGRPVLVYAIRGTNHVVAAVVYP